MPSTSTTDEHVNNITIAVNAINAIIENNVAAGTMNDTDANLLLDMLIRIQTDTAFLNVLINFSLSFLSSWV